MTGALIVLLAVASPPATESSSAGLPDAALLAVAEQSFASGVALRGDSAGPGRPSLARRLPTTTSGLAAITRRSWRWIAPRLIDSPATCLAR